MTKEMEALLLVACKASGFGVVGVNPKRAADFGVPVGRFVREGEKVPGSSRKAKRSGYYCPKRGQACLTFDAYSPGDGWTRYRVAKLTEDGTGQADFSGAGSMSAIEMRAWLRGYAEALR